MAVLFPWRSSITMTAHGDSHGLDLWTGYVLRNHQTRCIGFSYHLVMTLPVCHGKSAFLIDKPSISMCHVQ